MSAASLSIVLASALAVGPGLGAERIAASRMAPSAGPPTAAEGSGGAPDEGWGEEDKVPEEGWGDGDTVPSDGDPTTPPAGDPTTTPTTTPPTGPTPNPGAPGTVLGGSGIEKKPAPEPQGGRGIGLMVAAGAVGAIAWGMAGAQAVTIKQCGDGVSDGGSFNGILDCVLGIPRICLFTIFKWLANDTTYGLAPGAGMVRGRYEAAKYMYSGKPDRKGPMLAGIGGGLLGFGVVLKVALWATTRNIFNCPFDGTFAECVGGRAAGYFIGHQVASSSAAAGAGLLAFGIFYNKERKARERLFFRPETVRVSPSIALPGNNGVVGNGGNGMSFNGLSVSGQF